MMRCRTTRDASIGRGRGRCLRGLAAGFLAVALCAAGWSTVLGASDAHAAPAFSTTTLHFDVPGEGAQRCDIIGDVYVPAGASASTPAPAILTTNGFSGSKNSQRTLAEMFARRGYVVLAYSGLGFGGSGCRISFDTPSIDGRAASRLIDYLGGAPRIAYTDAAHRHAAPPLTVVRRDTRAHDTAVRTHDPRVGMVGGSYGGAIQFATAAADSRLDTIVPMATWNDLTYSLAPNNTGQTVGVSTRVQGASKTNWSTGLGLAGVVAGVQHADTDPARLTGCPDFPPQTCAAFAAMATTGVVGADVRDRLRAGSVVSYIDRVRIPTLLIQGEKDTLFNLNEATATYRGLSAGGVPTQLIWYSGGHSRLPETGDFVESRPDPQTQYLTRRIVDWTDHHLRDGGTGSGAGTGPRFSYFRPWIPHAGNATPAYASASTVDVGTPRRFRISGTGALVGDAIPARPGTAVLTTPGTGLPSGSDAPDAGGVIPSVPVTPNSSARWTGAPLPARMDIVGSPTVRLQVHAPAGVGAPVANQLVLFFRVLDVDAAGRSTIVGDQVAPVRISDPRAPFTVTMPAVVHRFAAGHRIGLEISGQSNNYRGGLAPITVSVAAGDQQVLTLPAV